MTTRRERDFLQADYAATRGLLDRLGDDQFIERIGLEARLETLEAELQQLKADLEAPEATVTFGGAPVRDQRGIEATFAADALQGFQDLVARVGAARRHGALGAGGPIPEARAFQLHVTGIARGSFGFEFERLEGDPGELSSEVRDAVQETAAVLASMKGSDEDFAGTLAELDARVSGTLRGFIERISKANATVKMIAGERVVEFSENDVQLATERITSAETTTEVVEREGELVGFLPESAAFEFKVAGGDVLRGKLTAESNQPEALKHVWGTRSVASLRVTTVSRPGRESRRAYQLLSVPRALSAG